MSAQNGAFNVLGGFGEVWSLSTPTIIIASLVAILPAIALAVFELFFRTVQLPGPVGCRRLGLQGRTNLQDQYDKRYAKAIPISRSPAGRTSWKVKALFIYPIKSCHSVELGRGEVIATGLRYDRQYSFAVLEDGKSSEKGDSEPQWNFITQRRFPKLARVSIDVWIPETDPLNPPAQTGYVRAQGCLVVSFPYTGRLLSVIPRPSVLSFRVPFEPTKDQIAEHNLESVTMKIWSDSPTAINMTKFIRQEVLEELQKFLNVSKPLGLFRVEPTKERKIFKNAPRKEELGFQPIHGFTDAYPLHFNNLASIRDLATRVPTNFGKLSALRFRSNIYITGPEAYNEDTWKRIRIGKSEYIVTNRTTRCTLPCVDPATGAPQPYKRDGKVNPLFNEPLKTLKKYRLVDEGAPDEPCLGMQMISAAPEPSMIRVGDDIEVLETGEHYYISSRSSRS